MKMAKRVRLLAQAGQSEEACAVTAAVERTSAGAVKEAHRQTKRLSRKIAKLENEKRTLLEEMKSLETRAIHGWTRMSRRQICSVALLGIIVTALVILIPPFFIDPLVSENLPLSTLDHQTKLVSYLREIQGYENVYLGVHGYDHKCPIDGSNGYELVCPVGQIPVEEIRRRIGAGLETFKNCGLEVDCYCFPGEGYDDRVLSVLSEFSPSTPKSWGPGSKKYDLTLNSSLSDPIVYFGFKLEAWMWRDGVSEERFQAALTELVRDKPPLVLVHIQDLTNQTLDLLQCAVVQANVGIIRCDDITFDSDVEPMKGLVDLARKYDVDLVLAVIPASQSGAGGYFPGIEFKAVWILSTVLFVFPSAVMIPWALIFKSKKRKPWAKWNPHYPSVSLILPAYNEEKTIGKAIERSLSQRYMGSLEVIVIDDGSSDGTYGIAKKFADKHANVRVIRYEKNRGKSYALNTGFAEARGEISIFCDADSVLAPEAVSRMVSHFKDPKVGMVAGMVIVRNEKNLLTRLQQIEYLFTQSIMRFCQSSHRNVLICPGACTAVRTDIARKIPSTDRTITEDADFTFSAWKDGWKICQEPESVSYTEAPESLKGLINQRRRWLYGSLQTIAIHKWAARSGNPWVLKAWLECFLSPFTLIYLVSFPLLYSLFSANFPMFLLTYGLLPSAIMGLNGAIGVKLFNRGEKSRLVFLMPVYVVYELMLNLLLIYLIFAFVSRRGIRIMRGGRMIHAV
jgi:cellulose synthase/poly-beta-1,6-N-acetylglucosamine synthase-like glycosyltransferase